VLDLPIVKTLIDHLKTKKDEKEWAAFETVVKTFVERLSRTGWLVAISSPTVVFNFPDVGQKFEQISDCFAQYATQDSHVEAVKDRAPVCCVRLVAWPCLQVENNYLTKGEVVVVSESGV